ncbi:hypothetical protein TTRE_0000259601 [Trichuris trichiura]|uniref:Uncharacterized protein n=1 Tax=Trichuris trichiura TaxID=36087 RepID=A0A077Z2R5_TRITR|nr:hypothetical protein TTRE_0000259601 [Trichuris trichiura]
MQSREEALLGLKDVEAFRAAAAADQGSNGTGGHRKGQEEEEEVSMTDHTATLESAFYSPFPVEVEQRWQNVTNLRQFHSCQPNTRHCDSVEFDNET